MFRERELKSLDDLRSPWGIHKDGCTVEKKKVKSCEVKLPIQVNVIIKGETMSETVEKKDEVNAGAAAVKVTADIGEMSLEDYVVPDISDTEVKDESGGSTTIAFLGSGQGGSRITKAFHDIGYKKSIILNTTSRDLDLIEFPEKQKYLMTISQEGGAGKDMAIGSRAVELHESNIKRLMEKVFGPKIDQILITIGSGGGTGAGSVLRLIEIARNYVDFYVRDNEGNKVDPGERVGVIVALPTRGESISPLVKANAYKVVTSLFELAKVKKISPLIIVDNDRIDHLIGSTLTTKNYYPEINKQIATLFNAFNRLSNLPSEFISFDPTDFQSILRCGGCCTMGVAGIKEYSTADLVIANIRTNLEKTLLAPNFTLKTAKFAGVVAVAGSRIISDVQGLPSNINSAFDMFSELLSSNVNLHRGFYEGQRDKLVVYTIVSGLDLCWNRINQLK